MKWKIMYQWFRPYPGTSNIGSQHTCKLDAKHQLTRFHRVYNEEILRGDITFELLREE